MYVTERKRDREGGGGRMEMKVNQIKGEGDIKQKKNIILALNYSNFMV